MAQQRASLASSSAVITHSGIDQQFHHRCNELSSGNPPSASVDIEESMASIARTQVFFESIPLRGEK
jgi:hypothetical protein